MALMKDVSTMTKVHAIGRKPKVTVNLVQPGDVVLLYSDGIDQDNVSVKAMNTLIEQNVHPQPTTASAAASEQNSKRTLAKTLVDYAVKEAKADDNVTVVAIKVN